MVLMPQFQSQVHRLAPGGATTDIFWFHLLQSLVIPQATLRQLLTVVQTS